MAFYINILGKNNQPKTLTRETVTTQTKISKVKEIICFSEGGDDKKLEISASGKTLENEKTLKDYDIDDEFHMIIIIFHVGGGAAARAFSSKHPLIKLSNDIDCISLEKDNNYPRSKMNCGHSISCESMYQYIKTCAERLDIIDIKCPVPNCEIIWDFKTISVVAAFSPQEYLQYSSIFEQRRVKINTRQCPNCNVFVKRPNDLSYFRLVCTSCNGDHFCFLCNKKWLGNGLQVCGNAGCATEQINKTLSNCKMVQPTYIKNQVPQFRACPVCITLIAHEANCKVMTCYNCKCKFCFSCLLYSKENKYPCDPYKDCEIKPRQILN